MPRLPADRLTRTLTLTAMCLAAVLVVGLVAWGVDSAVHSDKVRRNVTLVDRAVGGLDDDDLRQVVAELAEQYQSTPVQIMTPEASMEATAATMGLSVDTEATVAAVQAIDADVGLLARPGRWLGTLLNGTDARLVFAVDEATAIEAAGPIAAANVREATEPTITDTDGVITVVAGADGSSLPSEVVPSMLAAEATRTQWGPLQLELTPTLAPTRFDDTQAQQLAAEANDLTSSAVTVVVGEQQVAVQPAMMRTWLRADTTASQLDLVIDEERAGEDLRSLVGDIGQPAVQLSWFVEAGTPGFTEGQPGLRCCSPDSTERVIEALRAGEDTVELAFESVPPDHDAAWAESLNIVEPVASFTTPHACCQNRVANIQRMADIVRGAVIEPGGTFSINDHVGRRTTEGGFLSDGVIYNGRLTRDVGGGVSQFATSMFNAAFFAGLEIPEYQMHTLYISRYPYGREATLSHPAPDLKVRNNTDHGVLIWPTYTDTSITVTLYSTKTIEADQTGQIRFPAGRCTGVETERTRTWIATGEQATDTFRATYQPADGVLC